MVQPLRVASMLAVVTSALTLLAAHTRASAQTPDLFDDIYSLGQHLERTLKTVSARFTETSTSRLLAKPLIARGTIAVQRPDRIVLQYLEPESRVVLITGDLLTMSWPSRALYQRSDIGTAQRRIHKYFVGKSPAELRRHFTISAAVEKDRAKTWRVTLVPKRKQFKESVSRIDLWIAQEAAVLSAMKMEFPNGDTKLMTFDQVVINHPVDAAMFTIPR